MGTLAALLKAGWARRDNNNVKHLSRHNDTVLILVKQPTNELSQYTAGETHPKSSQPRPRDAGGL